MIIRAVTGFAPPGEGALRTLKVAAHLRDCGHEVQTVRLATPPWESWCDAEALPARARELEAAVVAAGVQFLSLGPCSAEGVPAAVEALLAWMRRGPAGARATDITVTETLPRNDADFVVTD